jgi:hypothetical protein
MKPLPDKFLAYHSSGGLTEGPANSDVLGWFQLWPVNELEYWNEQYRVGEYAPGLCGFGSNGGGCMLAFDAEGRILLVDFIGMELEYAQLVASSWDEFERIISA